MLIRCSQCSSAATDQGPKETERDYLTNFHLVTLREDCRLTRPVGKSYQEKEVGKSIQGHYCVVEGGILLTSTPVTLKFL